jgi:pimeloyl-ACP methyl ester carboxylesterase
MNTRVIILLAILLLIFTIFLVNYLSSGAHYKAAYIQNFEDAEYGPFSAPHSIENGLAVYSVGKGEPVLLFPYPHAHTTRPMADGELAQTLVKMGRRVITFDVPGAYHSTRTPKGDMAEIITSADEALSRLGIQDAIDVVGHSMSGFAALAYAVERPYKVNRLILVGSLSGFPAAARYGLPRSTFSILEPDFWRIVLWGIQVNAGRATLARHKQLQNLMEHASFYKKDLFNAVEIKPDDNHQGIPIRMIWNRNMYRRLSYADKLTMVAAPTLILVGRHDPEAPVACSKELQLGIPDAHMIIFEESGHFPFIEQPNAFLTIVRQFFDD